jgi:hypothetical protein
MKLSQYHKLLGDKVTFFKGDISDLIINDIIGLAIKKLETIDNSIYWRKHYPNILNYIKNGDTSLECSIAGQYKSTIKEWLSYFRDYYKKRYTRNIHYMIEFALQHYLHFTI